MELPQRFAELPPAAQVLVVCRVGARSAQATGYLVAQGIEAVNLDGGMLEWEAAGRAMVSETDGPPQVV
jgi:rhodanese-related sulfurtransferase